MTVPTVTMTTSAKPKPKPTTRRSRTRQPRTQNRLDTKEFKEVMRTVIRKHISNIEKKFDIMSTTLPLEELLWGGKKKRGCRGISRPQNAFVLYRKDVQARLLLERENKLGEDSSKLSPKNASGFFSEISSTASKEWAKESQNVKDFFLELSKAAYSIHKELFPEYKYCPKSGKRSLAKRKKELELSHERKRSATGSKISISSASDTATTNPVVDSPVDACRNTAYLDSDYSAKRIAKCNPRISITTMDSPIITAAAYTAYNNIAAATTATNPLCIDEPAFDMSELSDENCNDISDDSDGLWTGPEYNNVYYYDSNFDDANNIDAAVVTADNTSLVNSFTHFPPTQRSLLLPNDLPITPTAETCMQFPFNGSMCNATAVDCNAIPAQYQSLTAPEFESLLYGTFDTTPLDFPLSLNNTGYDEDIVQFTYPERTINVGNNAYNESTYIQYGGDCQYNEDVYNDTIVQGETEFGTMQNCYGYDSGDFGER
ncbi:6962_t:CDS:1 [Paraglomus occultum]|uniref:6962_t:CDS:1 n=1 Tax=Paraglomus occultum TaxID=144539 RepID=A0A9N9GHV4_9GLOM|nr:6962_t:CDS:1 [Paraglomus occultum]